MSPFCRARAEVLPDQACAAINSFSPTNCSEEPKLKEVLNGPSTVLMQLTLICAEHRNLDEWFTNSPTTIGLARKFKVKT